jgi:hypothetical protein
VAIDAPRKVNYNGPVKLESDTKVGFPRERVWQTYVEDLEKLVEYLPNVSLIERKSREEAGDVVKLVRLWTAKATLPDVARSIVKPNMMQWTDYASWDRRSFRCDWRIESGALPKALECSGSTLYEETSSGCLVSLRGDLAIHPEHVPGVPRIFARTIQPIVERVIVAGIEPNLRGIAGGVEKYLKARG